jgi:hypothetical protein
VRGFPRNSSKKTYEEEVRKGIMQRGQIKYAEGMGNTAFNLVLEGMLHGLIDIIYEKQC